MGRRTVRAVAGLVSLVVLTAGATAQSTEGLQRGLQQTEQQRERAEQRLQERRADEGDARARLEAAEAEHARAKAALAEIEDRLAAATRRRDEATENARALRAELVVAEADLVESEADLAEVQLRFDARVTGAYKRGSAGAETRLVGQLLTQDTIADALATAPFLTAVMDADRRVVIEVNEVRDEVAAQRATIASLRGDAEREAQDAEQAARVVTEQAAAQQGATEELAARRVELDAAYEAIVTDRRAVESHLASIDAESSRLEGELRAIAEQRAREARERAAAEAAAERSAQEAAERRAAEERAARRERNSTPTPAPAPTPTPRPAPSPSNGGGGSGGGGGDAGSGGGSGNAAPPSGQGWRWPAACGRVTSRYGGRSVEGGSSYHRGVDIACTRVLGPNPAISASRGGVISPVGCGGGYGVCLIVDHLDGWFSLYAHMSSVAVNAGTSVSAGQVIGYEGSTGNSTGPHLHFEIWNGGTKVDPCPHIGC